MGHQKKPSEKKEIIKSSKASPIEQKKTLEKFRRMATVIQDSNDAITFQDLEGNILAWNRGAEKMYGYSEAEALRMNIVDTVPPEYQEEAREFISTLKRGELLPNLETKRKTKDGRIVDVWLTNTKLTDDKGKLTGIATTERDISERTGSLEKFRRMATVIQDSNDAITFQDLEGNILAWNRGAEIMYGYTEAEALRMNIVDTVPPEYQEEARGFLASLKRGELLPNLETKRKHKDGRIIDVWLTNTKLTDDKGKLTGIATTERDITVQTKTLEKFRRMATVIQDSNDAITFQDLEGNILAWNRGAEIMYGYSEVEALTKNIVDTVPPEYQEEARGFITALKSGELVPTLETKRKTKDGRIVDVSLTNTKLTDDKGNLTGVATTERDISEQTGSLEKFRRMATVIQDSNDAVTFQDLEGNILAWNRGAEIMYGYSEAEALRMNIVDTVPPEYQEEARGFLASLKRGEVLPNLDTKRKTKDGKIVDVSLTNTKLTDDKGNLTGIATTERDITVQTGSLEKFRRMATVIQDSNDAVTFQDLEGNILAWNRGAEIMYGYSEAEALRMNIVDTVPPEYQEEARGFLASLKRGEVLPNLDTKRKTKDGKIVDVSLTNTKLTDDKGKLTGIATTERDITVQTGSLEKFRRMATVIQDSNDAVTFQDLEGNILAWNRGAELMYGYSEAEALRMNIVDTVPKEYQEEARGFLASLKRGELLPNLETKRKHKDGRIIDVWLTNTKLTDDKGNLTGIATTERDISEQNKTLERFRRMATVIKDSNDAITFQDLEGNILAWNRGAELMYGYLEAEALSMNIVDTVPKEYQEEARGFLASLKRGELVPTLETKRKHKDGRIIDVWLTNTKLTDDKGKLSGIATTEREITAIKQSEALIREKSRELEYLQEGLIALSERMRGQQDISRLGQNILGHLVPFTNAQLGAFYWAFDEKKLQRVSGYAFSKTEASEKTIEFGEGLIGQAALEKRSLLIDNVPTGYFNKIKSDLGEMTPRSLIICPILYDDEVNGVIEIASVNPFTEHQRAFLSHVSGSIGIAINTSNVRKKVQELFEQSQTLNQDLQSQQAELKTANEELEEQSRALKESQTRLENQQSELEQTNNQLEEQAQALEQQKDILNEKNKALNKAQVLLEEKTNEVQRASQYKTEFLANMSHELRTPLNSSLILAKLLMDNTKGNLTEDQVEFANSIYSSGNDLLNLINDILDLSKVEAGKLDIRIENVFIPKVLESLKQTFQALAFEKKLKFEVISEVDTPEAFITDRQRLEQILKNLLSNALKFTSEGFVKIRLFRHSKGNLAFEVSDSGIGIPKEQQEIIFEAFRQADGTTNRKYGGSGLGLSISRDLARLLGGSIEVKSIVGVGSSFTLILPESYDNSTVLTAPLKAYSETQSEIQEEIVNQKEQSKQIHFEKPLQLPFSDDRADLSKPRRTILVIEDEPKFSKILYDLAHELNFKCLVAQGADEGFEMVLEYQPDAILLDMILPDHIGLTVLDRLKQNTKTRHIPVHVISVDDYSEIALQMGAIGYMLKPIKREEIKNAFAKLEAKLSQKISRVLVVEDNEIQRKSICHLIEDEGIEITNVGLAKDALVELKKTIFDCMIMDLKLPDMPGDKLLELMTHEQIQSFPPVIVYTGSSLSKDEEDKLRKYSKSIIIKGAKSPERLLDEVTLFLHRVESEMPAWRRQMLKLARNREQTFEGRKILLVDDDIRNIFALTSALEQKGAIIIVGRNGHEALAQLDLDPTIDLVLMDIMMPEMDGHEATRRIRKQKRFEKLPIIAVTARAMKDDQEKCLEAGANDYLSKPVDLDKLLSLIRVWMPKTGWFNG